MSTKTAAALGSSVSGATGYDVIIVGGGTAGCVLASRLSADSARRVLLIEAGHAAQPADADIPARWIMQSGTEVDWCFSTVPQAHAESRSLTVPRGKLLGGSSVINAMIHHRGTPDDYDRWEALGATGWNWCTMEEMFRRSEHWRGSPDPRRGAEGPVIVTPAAPPSPAAACFIEAALQAGHVLRPDLNAAPGCGISPNQLAWNGTQRMSSYRAYLEPILDRANLVILTGAEAAALTFSGDRCTGVRLRVDGLNHLLSSRGDVILAAGAIHSPHILLRSGIGPAKNLKAAGIEPVVDLAGVGENLHEHVLFPGCSIATKTAFSPSVFMGTDAVLYASATRSSATRDIMLNFANDAHMPPGLESVAAGCKTSFAFMKPKSRGRITLGRPGPLSAPRIDFNALAHPDDMSGSRTALAMARDILNGPRFAAIRLREICPGPHDEDDFLRRSCLTFGHSVGTCRMGTDAESVVDASLKVHGIANLFVVDASVIPEIPSAPTNATVLAIAERASAMLIGA